MVTFSITHFDHLPYQKGQVVFSELYGHLLVKNVNGKTVMYGQLSKNKFIRKLQLFSVKKK